MSKHLILLITALLVSLHTHAGDWYGSLGYTRSEGDPVGNNNTAFDVDREDSGSGWQLNGGYQFNEYFNLEIGYVDYGEQTHRLTLTPLTALARIGSPNFSPSPPLSTISSPFLNTVPAGGISGVAAFVVPVTPPFVEVSTETQGIRLGASGVLPLGEWFSLSMQGGTVLSRYKTRVDSHSVFGYVFGQPTYVVNSQSDKSTGAEIFAGLGMQLKISSGLAVKLTWERILNLGENNSFEQDLDSYNLFLIYRL